MITIYLPLDMEHKGSIEAKRLLIFTIEQINQRRIKLEKRHEDKLGFLVRQFNDGIMDILDFQDGLVWVLKESIRMAKA